MLERIYVAIDIGETCIKAVAMNEYASKLSVIGARNNAFLPCLSLIEYYVNNQR